MSYFIKPNFQFLLFKFFFFFFVKIFLLDIFVDINLLNFKIEISNDFFQNVIYSLFIYACIL